MGWSLQPPDKDQSESRSSDSNLELTLRERVPGVAMGAVIGARGDHLDELKSLNGCTRLVIEGVKGDTVWTLLAWVPNGGVADEIKNLVRANVKASKTGVERAVRQVVASYILVR